MYMYIYIGMSLVSNEIIYKYIYIYSCLHVSTIQNMIHNNIQDIETTMEHYLEHNTIRDKGMKESNEEWMITKEYKDWCNKRKTVIK